MHIAQRTRKLPQHVLSIILFAYLPGMVLYRYTRINKKDWHVISLNLWFCFFFLLTLLCVCFCTVLTIVSISLYSQHIGFPAFTAWPFFPYRGDITKESNSIKYFKQNIILWTVLPASLTYFYASCYACKLWL